MMETILNLIPWGTTVAGAVLFLIYYKENKKLKANEAEQSAVKTQDSQIDLGVKFMKSSMEAVEIMQQSTQEISAKLAEMDGKQEERLTAMEKTIDVKMTSMSRSLSGNNRRLSIIEKFLDGPLKEFSENVKKKGGKNDKATDNVGN